MRSTFTIAELQARAMLLGFEDYDDEDHTFCKSVGNYALDCYDPDTLEWLFTSGNSANWLLAHGGRKTKVARGEMGAADAKITIHY